MVNLSKLELILASITMLSASLGFILMSQNVNKDYITPFVIASVGSAIVNYGYRQLKIIRQ